MTFDMVLVGGGLQNALIALAVLHQCPQARLALLEKGPVCGGNHLWSCHESHLPEAALPFMRPLVVARWAGHEVRFPTLRRTFDSAYLTISSSRLHEVLQAAFQNSPGSRLMLNSEVTEVQAHGAVLANGTRVSGRAVIDARGPERLACGASTGFQKFVGIEFQLAQPHALAGPIIMDASVEQSDGLRFVYTLPLSPRRVLIEDTYFSDSSSLDVDAIRPRIDQYASALGLSLANRVREETGVLPLPLTQDFVPASDGILHAGYAGGFFHPTTGYSLPFAARLAVHAASSGPEELLGPRFAELAARHAAQLRFALMLNRLLFRATRPGNRRDVMERFYRLPRATIERFYALTTTPLDRARILVGRPPRGVSIRAALAEVLSP